MHLWSGCEYVTLYCSHLFGIWGGTCAFEVSWSYCFRISTKDLLESGEHRPCFLVRWCYHYCFETYIWFGLVEVKIDKVWLFLGRTFRGRISAREISLTNLQLQDSAVYQCEASNKHGTILASANVNVLSE